MVKHDGAVKYHHFEPRSTVRPIHHTVHHISVGVIAGIGVGTVAAILLVGACAYQCYRKRRGRGTTATKNTLIFSFTKGNDRDNHKQHKTSGGTFNSITPASRPLPLMKSPGQSLIETMTIPKGRQSRKNSTDIEMSQIKTECYYEFEKDGNTPEGSDKAQTPDDNDTLGMIYFTLDYDNKKMALIVHLLNAHNLPVGASGSHTCDPYVKLQLLPDRKHKVKTRVLRKTHNPKFDEIFTFYGIAPNQVGQTRLHFLVLRFDRFSRDEIIGEVLHSLKAEDLSEGQVAVCKAISPRKHTILNQGRGDLLLSLCYQPVASRLTVVILKARNLPKMDITGSSDPYIKIYLMYEGHRIAKKKTHIKRRSLNPVFNESFLFDIPPNTDVNVEDIGLEFVVMDWDRVTKDEVIGRVEIGSHAQGDALHHWHEVLNCPRKQIAQWHNLSD